MIVFIYKWLKNAVFRRDVRSAGECGSEQRELHTRYSGGCGVKTERIACSRFVVTLFLISN
jgi:hypothetical protein|eukprot:COSAG06_NODE_1407_length_9550_cov_1.910380_7_plen_61_part_00